MWPGFGRFDRVPPRRDEGSSATGQVLLRDARAATGRMGMNGSYRDLTQSVTGSLGQFRADLPEVMKAFGALGRAATQDGALDRKTKELLALCLGVAGHCDACIGFHMQTLVKLGATRAEVEEALSVAVYMGGGPSLMYAANALAAFAEFSGPG
jgi:AhpD family alkylhydroperoxidase